MKKTVLLTLALLLGAGIPALAREKQERYDDSARPVIVPRGNWLVGGNAAYSGHRNDNYDFAVVKGINSVGFHVAAAPEVCYFFRDNLGAGLRIGYGRRMLDAQSGSAQMGSLELGVNNYYTLSQDVNAMAFLRYYLPVADSKRISFHVDAGLQGAFGQSRRSDEHTGAEVGSWEKNYRVGLLLQPGISALVTRRMAVFASLGMAGISYGRKEQTHNQVDPGSSNSYAIQYLMDFTSLRFGIDLILGKR